MNEKTKQTNENGATSTGNLLASLTVEYMSNIRVVLINKPGLSVPAANASMVTLKRHLENPDELAVHGDVDDGQHPIFNRNDIDVNNEENLEERIELTLPDDETKNRDNERKRTKKRFQKCRRSSSISSRSRSPSAEKVCKVKRDSKEYDLLEKRGRSPSTSRRSREREQNVKEKCCASCREGNCRNSRSAGYSCEHYSRNCSRSYSPGKSSYEHKKSYIRSPSRSPRKHCISSPNKRHYRKYSYSPTPDSKRQDQRFKENREREKRETQRNIRSSSREKNVEYSSHSRRNYKKDRASPASHSRQSSHSPQSRRSSPSRDSPDARSKQRSLTLSKKPQNVFHYDERHGNQYGVPPYNFGYYGAEGLWIPGPLQRPHFIPPPMPMVGGPSYFIPRPYMSVPHPLHRFRPSGTPYRHRRTAPSESTLRANVVNASATRTPSVIIEEPSSTSE